MYKDKKTHQIYTNRYIADNYDRFNITAPKGSKALLQEYIRVTGDKSITALVLRSIRNQIIADGGDITAWDALTPDGNTADQNGDNSDI